MTKAELLDAVAKRAGVTKADAEKVLDSFFAEAADAAKGMGSVSWPGFGKFSGVQRAARTVANPQDRTKKVKVPASVAIRFTPSTVLKKELNTKSKAKKAPAKKK
jgi:DNA-binding protein HU-beta